MGFLRQDIKSLPTKENLAQIDRLDRERAQKAAPLLGEEAINGGAPSEQAATAPAPGTQPGIEVVPPQPEAGHDISRAA